MDIFEDELLSVLITDLRERALAEFRRSNPDIRQLYQAGGERSVEKERVLRELPAEKRQVLEDYLEHISMLANSEMDYLYVQGIKDGIRLLQLLGAL